MMAETTDMLLSTFHLMGLHQKEIRIYLQNCNIVMSKTTLKRHLKKLGLYRRKNYSDMCDVALFIMAQLNTSDKMLGYRMMHLKCIQEGFVVTHDHVRLLLRILDKEGVQMRKKRRLRRRAYHNLGPNFLWHVDSYDKLKPYGICINGCVDGFSRRVIWLEAWKTSSDPFIIAGYFLEACKKINGCPMRVRTDFGTENVDIANIQRFLRQEDGDEYSGDASFIYGSSTHNQRIESWWGQLRKQNAQYWMNLFQMMKDENIFTGSFLDKSLIQFCFMDLVQKELDGVSDLWNLHKIRRSTNQNCPEGKPTLMYDFPQIYGVVDWIRPKSIDDFEICELHTTDKGVIPCDDTVFDTCKMLMAENNLFEPSTATEAKELYNVLRDIILENL